MKNKVILCTLVAIVAFGAGYLTNQKVNRDNTVVYQALEQAEKVMMNNDLFDEDGSDDMYEYMCLKEKADQIINNQN